MIANKARCDGLNPFVCIPLPSLSMIENMVDADPLARPSNVVDSSLMVSVPLLSVSKSSNTRFNFATSACVYLEETLMDFVSASAGSAAAAVAPAVGDFKDDDLAVADATFGSGEARDGA